MNSNLLPIIAYISVCFFWGTSPVATKLGASALSPLAMGASRYLTATLIVFCLVKFKGLSLKIKRHDFRVLFISSFIMFFIHTGLLLLASVRVEAGISTIALCMIPICFVILESCLNRKLMVNFIGFIGVIGGITGIVIVTLGGMKGGGVDAISIILLTVAILAWGVGSIYLKHSYVECSMLVQLFYQSAVPLVFFSISAFLTRSFNFENVSIISFMPAVYMAVSDNIIGLMAFSYLMKKWPISLVGTYAYINPIVGLVLSSIIFKEVITAQKIIGLLIILISVTIIQKQDSIKEKLIKKTR